MNSPTDSSIDDLAASATVKTYGDIRQRLMSGPLDADALRLRLQSITPPPDEEEDDEESRLLESQARNDLESDGCPPCYPPYLDTPVRDPPEEFRSIIEFWRSLSSTGDVILCAQRSDWRKFRASRTRVRSRYQDELFSTYVNEVCERRRRHELDDNVHLLLDSRQQSQQENWIEFQDYHLKHHERLEKKRTGLKKDLDETRRIASNADIEGSERAAQNENAIQGRLEYTERTLRWHEVLLGWVEQQRLTMDSRPLTPVEEDACGQDTVLKAVRKSSTRQRRLKGPGASAVLGKARVSKSKSKSRNAPNQTSNASKSQPSIVYSGVTTPNSIQQVPKRRENKPRRAKDAVLGPVGLQRVSKAKRYTDISTKARPVTQHRGDRAPPQHQSTPQRSHPAPGPVETRSGRI
ncbi:MAG: hypothetical protein Q9214_003750 [Letrouitia sp. 1 TL-2023]